MRVAPEMRRVRFALGDRLAVVPVELVLSTKWVVVVAAAFFLLSGLAAGGYAPARLTDVGLCAAALLAFTWIASIVLTAALLPWLPGRALAVKGTWVGALLAAAAAGLAVRWPEAVGGRWSLAGWCLLLPALASFMAMNYTGATTYTSLSGVRKEMRVAVPLQLIAAAAGLVLWLVGRFV
jgi:hypothetical protein